MPRRASPARADRALSLSALKPRLRPVASLSPRAPTRNCADRRSPLPIYPLKGYSITVRPAIDAIRLRASITDARRKVVFAPIGDRVRVAGFIEIGAGGNEIPPARTSALLDAAREVLGYNVIDGDIRPWIGQRPATPSGRPVIGRTAVEHLYLNVGHGALGWTLAGGSARLICDAIAGSTPTIDVRPIHTN